MQISEITSYDADLSFFMDKFIIYVIIQHTKSYMLHFIYLILFIDVSIEKKIRNLLLLHLNKQLYINLASLTGYTHCNSFGR